MLKNFSSKIKNIVNSFEKPEKMDNWDFEKYGDIRLENFHVKTEIKSRFATTAIICRMINLSKTAKEISFTPRLPEEAFITDFCMQIGDKIVHGEVKEKGAAKKKYDAAKRKGKSAGHVFQVMRQTDIFTVSTNVGAKTEVIFTLTYQEILRRVHGAYKHVINLDLEEMQPQSNIQIEVEIIERGKITKIHVPRIGPKMGEKTNSELLKWEIEPKSHVIMAQDDPVTTATVVYRVPAQELMQNQREGGQFVLLYDIDRDATGGQVQVVNGYFLHFFAPEGLQAGGKHVIFVLDKSGSMLGRKMQQTKDAMRRILGDLRKVDMFNIIWFSYTSEIWKPKSVMATNDNLLQAISDVEHAEASGGTSAYDGLMDGLNLLHQSETNPLVSMIIFMTDGQANVGPEKDELAEKIKTRNQESKFVIHAMAFGNTADYELLQRVSSDNNGIACKIHEDLDADVQLIGFYQQISSPLLADVKITYTQGAVDVESLVYGHTSTYYNGSEMMVLGRLSNLSLVDSDDEPLVEAEIDGRGCCGLTRLVAKCCLIFSGQHPPSEPRLTTKAAADAGEFVERMWAYQTIKKLLKESKFGHFSNSEKKAKTDEALKLCLKYRFVTELTSMVVVEDDLQKVESLQKHELESVVDYLPAFPEASAASKFGVFQFSPCAKYAKFESCTLPAAAHQLSCQSSSSMISLREVAEAITSPSLSQQYYQEQQLDTDKSRKPSLSLSSADFMHGDDFIAGVFSESDCIQIFGAPSSPSHSQFSIKKLASYLIIIIIPAKPIDPSTAALIAEWKTILVKFYENLSTNRHQITTIRLFALNPENGQAINIKEMKSNETDFVSVLENVFKEIFEEHVSLDGYQEIEDLVIREESEAESVSEKKQIWMNVEDQNVVFGPLSEVFHYLNKKIGYDYLSRNHLENPDRE